jgi:hypothetical protein
MRYFVIDFNLTKNVPDDIFNYLNKFLFFSIVIIVQK